MAAAFPTLSAGVLSDPVTTPTKADGPSITVYGAGEDSYVPKTCSFCSHLAANLRSQLSSISSRIDHFRTTGGYVSKSLLHKMNSIKRRLEDVQYDMDRHSTRDADRNLVCPRLLAHRCEECGETGHTISRCRRHCEYCGKRGHILNECPAALANDKKNGMTVVLKGVTPEILDRIKLVLRGGIKVSP